MGIFHWIFWKKRCSLVDNQFAVFLKSAIFKVKRKQNAEDQWICVQRVETAEMMRCCRVDPVAADMLCAGLLLLAKVWLDAAAARVICPEN